MKFETQIHGNNAVLRVTGRLDATWAEHFHSAVQDVIRDGHHHVRIDASGLEYLSSAGIRSLLKLKRELTALKGSFAIICASPLVADTLRLSGLQQLLQPEAAPLSAATPAVPPPAGSPPEFAMQTVAGMRFEGHLLAAQGQVKVRAAGGWKPWQPVRAGDAAEVSFPRSLFGLGVGAPGSSLEDARPRFGEFVAAAGCLAWLPSDGANTPDYLEQAERFVPRLQVIQALLGEGSFSHLLQFSPEAKGNFLTLSDLYLQVLSATQASAAALIGLVEVEGLVGAALSRSPGLIQATDQPGEFPEVRNWLAFCGERVHRQAQALVVAVISRDPAHASVTALASLPSRSEIRAHAHAAILPYRPLPQGILELEASVRSVFEASEPLGLFHLLEDDRPAIGLGQSAFLRGTCWCAPMQFVTESLP